MKYYARFNSTDFPLLEFPTISDSSREVNFSDIQIDFRGFDENLLPIQYQEITIVEIDKDFNERVLFVGYADNVDFPEFLTIHTPLVISISLLSPYAYASKRTITREINEVPLNEAIEIVLSSLLEDGFTIETNELSTTKTLAIVFQSEPVEKAMNYLANTNRFIWYIDQTKKIFIKNLETLPKTNPVLTVTQENDNFLNSVKPFKTTVDYANVMQIKNAFVLKRFYNEFFTIPANSYYEFEYPFSISRNASSKVVDQWFYATPFYLFGKLNSVDTLVTLDYNKITNEVVFSNNVGFDGIDDKLILLVKSDVEETLIKGFKLNSNFDFVVPVNTAFDPYALTTDTIVTPIVSTYINPMEAEALRDKINTSGVIEKVIDANGRYFTEDSLFDYATSLFVENQIVTTEVEATFKGQTNDLDFQAVVDNLKITNVIGFDLDVYKIQGQFLITDIEKSYGNQTTTLRVKARNSNLNENFNDVFRNPIEEISQETAEATVTFFNNERKVMIERNVCVGEELVNK